MHADHIIAISQQTKNDILQYFNIDEQKISVVYQGCNPDFYQRMHESEKEKIRTKLHLPEQYILNVGTIEERKNALLIARALSHLPENIKLVLLGRQKPYAEKIKSFLKDNHLTERVIFLENIPQSYLPALFQMARVFVYPSRFEGFGIPVLEALNSRVPVVAATGSSLEEAGGPDSIYVNPDEPAALSKAIQNIITNAQLRHNMIENGAAYALRFREKEMAANMMHVYSHIMDL
jgi:glycosyltransferase involved in cell wall biosynthesis